MRVHLKSPRELFKKQMKNVRLEFKKQVNDKKVATIQENTKKQEIQNFMDQQRQLDIKEFKKEQILVTKPLQKREPKHHVSLEQQSKLRKDQLLSLYYSAKNFITYDTLDYHIELALKSKVEKDSIESRLAQMEARMELKANTLMNQYATTTNREAALKELLMGKIHGNPGQYQIEQKQAAFQELRSLVRDVAEKESEIKN